MQIKAEDSALVCTCSKNDAKDYNERIQRSTALLSQAYGAIMLREIMCPKAMLVAMAKMMAEGMALLPKSDRIRAEEEFKLLLEMEFSKHESI